MDEDARSAKGYRERAEQIRAEAEQMRHQETKKVLLEIAANYEKLAINLRTDLVTDCPSCHRPMLQADTCAVSHVTFSDDAKAERRRYAGETRCHDCGVSPGGFHHPFCEVEECPRCGAQLVCCPCKTQYVLLSTQNIEAR